MRSLLFCLSYKKLRMDYLNILKYLKPYLAHHIGYKNVNFVIQRLKKRTFPQKKPKKKKRNIYLTLTTMNARRKELSFTTGGNSSSPAFMEKNMEFLKKKKKKN